LRTHQEMGVIDNNGLKTSAYERRTSHHFLTHPTPSLHNIAKEVFDRVFRTSI